MVKRQIVLLFLVFLMGCTKTEPLNEIRFPVHVAKVIQEDIPYYIKAVGELVPSLAVDIKPQVKGILTDILFEDGMMVEENELLFKIDSRTYEAEVQQAEALLAVDQAKLKYAMDFAESYGSLVGKDYVARLDYKQGIQNVDVSRGAVELDLALLKIAKINLDHTQIRAPFRGYVGQRKFDPGNLVDPALNEVLTTVNQVSPITVKFCVPSQYVETIRQLQNAEPLYLEATLPTDVRNPLSGTVFCVDNTVNEETGMIVLRGTIPNKEEKGWPGQFVRVNLRLKIIEDAILVPENAIILGETGNFVFVLDEPTMTVQMRMIGKGLNFQGFCMAEWGIKPGEIVIVDGQANLFDGAKVSIYNPI